MANGAAGGTGTAGGEGEDRPLAERPFSRIGLAGLLAGPLVFLAFHLSDPLIDVSDPAWSMIGLTL